MTYHPHWKHQKFSSIDVEWWSLNNGWSILPAVRREGDGYALVVKNQDDVRDSKLVMTAADAEFLLSLSKEEAVEQLLAVYGNEVVSEDK